MRVVLCLCVRLILISSTSLIKPEKAETSRRLIIENYGFLKAVRFLV